MGFHMSMNLSGSGMSLNMNGLGMSINMGRPDDEVELRNVLARSAQEAAQKQKERDAKELAAVLAVSARVAQEAKDIAAAVKASLAPVAPKVAAAGDDSDVVIIARPIRKASAAASAAPALSPTRSQYFIFESVITQLPPKPSELAGLTPRQATFKLKWTYREIKRGEQGSDLRMLPQDIAEKAMHLESTRRAQKQAEQALKATLNKV